MHLPTDTPFALLRREGREHVELLTGPVEVVEQLADIPLDSSDVLALVPYRQVRERGFACVDDDTPLQVLRVASRTECTVEELELPPPAAITGGAFDVSDDEYGKIVEAVLRDEIGRGEGSNFVIHRVFEADVQGDPLQAALGVFATLLRQERGAYWTFLVHTGQSTLVGATPERHVSVADGVVMMNPISGTVRHPDRQRLLEFLADRKEIDELSMVLDEELKMMAVVADQGGQVIGPYLKEMSQLVHTEYLLAGRGAQDVRDVLRATMFAPTVVGSPIENACRVIARHEQRGRGYYAGVLALIGQGGESLDAPILIRTAEISPTGRLRVPVGATLVRHSTPAGEVAETHTKAAGVLSALGFGPARTATPELRFDPADPELQAALVKRNATLAPFWLQSRDDVTYLDEDLRGRSVLIVDAEDTFTGMLAHQLRVLGLDVTLRPYTAIGDATRFDLIVAGPGPGDPRVLTDPKMATMRALVTDLLTAGRPLLAVCLGHQILSGVLGLELRRKPSPYQGMQRSIDFFGAPATVGFYSTFAATVDADVLETPFGTVEVSRDADTGDVHALRGERFAGVQFHPESVLSQHGIGLLTTLVKGTLMN